MRGAIPVSVEGVSKPIFLGLIVCGLLVGIFIPAFYDWSGADQSRPSPVVAPIALALLVGWIGGCATMFFMRNDESAASQNSTKQFPLRTLLILTTAAAVCAAVLRSQASDASSGGLYAAVIVYSGSLLVRPQTSSQRWRVISLLTGMYLPFTWLLVHGHSSDSWLLTIYHLTLLPSAVLMLPLSAWTGRHPGTMLAVASMLASVQILVGLILFGRSDRLAIGYNSLCLLLSTYGSFVVNAILRM